jgi:phenylpropionate dioxygenase-like ring-hydroxylating dioxygenase large terminal subunit
MAAGTPEDWQRAALERLFGALEAKAQPLGERVALVPVDVYTSAARHEAERRLLGRLPLVAGAAARVRAAGDFFTEDVLDAPVLVTRDGAGTLRAFLNVCRHRGAIVEAAPAGHGATGFSCRYHGWSYGLDGALRGLPFARGFPQLERCQRGLVPLAVVEHAGLVYVRLEGDPSAAIEPGAAPLVDELEHFALRDREVFVASSRMVRANWKLMVETMLEAYHIAVLHQATGAAAFEDNFTWFEPLVGPSGRFLIPLRGARRPGPEQEDEWQLLFHAAVVYWLFPNTFVFMLGPFVHVMTICPRGLGECRVTSTALIDRRHTSEARRQAFQHAYTGYWQTIDEDVAIIEGVQRGLASGANRELVIGRHEYPIDTCFHAALDALLQAQKPLARNSATQPMVHTSCRSKRADSAASSCSGESPALPKTPLRL